MNWTATAAIALVLAVMIGAFGAHALSERIARVGSRSVYETAALYHFVHGLGMLIVSLLPRIGVLKQRAAAVVCGLMLAGIVLFSGSLYAFGVSGNSLWGAFAPFGGLCFIAAWLALAWWVMTRR